MTEEKQKHEHSFYPKEIYHLANFWYIIVRLECDCGEDHWDIGDVVPDAKVS